MKVLKVRKSGVVLLVSLLIVLIIGITGRAVISLYPGLLNLGGTGQTYDRAGRAAESGLEYALNRLRETPNWRATESLTLDEAEGLYVVEGDGNVIGLLTDKDGNVSQFRIRFNFQDGNGGPDGLADPSQSLWVEHPYISVNNLGRSGHTPLPRATGDKGQVLASDLDLYEAPGQSVFLLVEGRSGRGLHSLSKTAPNSLPDGPTVSAVVESCQQLRVKTQAPHASIMAGSDLNITIAPGEKVGLTVWGSDAEDLIPRLRSKGSVSVKEVGGGPGQLVFGQERGEIGRNNTGPLSFEGALGGKGADLIQESPGDGNGFYELAWEDVVQAKDAPGADDTIRLPAGTYVGWDDDTFHYYDMGFEEYKTYMSDPSNQGNPGVTLSKNFDEIREPENLRNGPALKSWTNTDQGVHKLSLGLFSDTRVIPSSRGVTDFTFTSRRGAKYSPTDDSTLIPDPGDSWSNANVAFQLRESTFSGPGDIRILSHIEAVSSTITTEGEFTMASSWGKLRQDKDNPDAPYGLNLYAQGDIKISTYKDATDNFALLGLHGLVYTWGDFEALTGHPEVDTSRWNESGFTGTIVAYGNNPAEGDPGEGGGGKVNIVSRSIGLWSDFGALAKVVETSSGNVSIGFEQTLFATHQGSPAKQ
jgi:hypothetical protein